MIEIQRVGYAPLDTHYDRLLDVGETAPGIFAVDWLDGDWLMALRWVCSMLVLSGLKPGHAAKYGNTNIEAPTGLQRLGNTLAERYQLAPPVGCLVHHTCGLAYHRDTQSPAGVTNLTVVSRDQVSGGTLVFPDLGLGVKMIEGSVVVFDGQQLHGITRIVPLASQFRRISLTYYVPT